MQVSICLIIFGIHYFPGPTPSSPLSRLSNTCGVKRVLHNLVSSIFSNIINGRILIYVSCTFSIICGISYLFFYYFRSLSLHIHFLLFGSQLVSHTVSHFQSAITSLIFVSCRVVNDHNDNTYS